jgi:hypothetical protein
MTPRLSLAAAIPAVALVLSACSGQRAKEDVARNEPVIAASTLVVRASSATAGSFGVIWLLDIGEAGQGEDLGRYRLVWNAIAALSPIKPPL